MSDFTPGPWRWELNAKSKQVQLCGGKHPYDLIVMDFVRWGMGGAAPRFREDRDELNLMHRCEKWAEPVSGREHHSNWFQTVNHPDMNLMAAAPDLLEACKAFIARYDNHMVNANLLFSDVADKARTAIDKALGVG